jgi:hypothetical protein
VEEPARSGQKKKKDFFLRSSCPEDENSINGTTNGEYRGNTSCSLAVRSASQNRKFSDCTGVVKIRRNFRFCVITVKGAA